jgi:RimJ/RimL family protein N-acetyltransferase
MDDLSLLSIVADTSFTFDTRGRMLFTNEPLPSARRPAPRLWIGHTDAGSVVRFGCALPDSLAEHVTVILGDEPVTPHLTRPPRALPAIRSALLPIARETAGPEYRFPGQLPAAPEAIAVMEENRELARDTFPWLLDEVAHWQPCFAIVRDGQAVSVCFSSRIGPSACAAGVETLPEFRGRGYASDATAAWAAAVRRTDRVPFYGTGWENVASRGVARRLGLVMFGASMSWD